MDEYFIKIQEDLRNQEPERSVEYSEELKKKMGDNNSIKYYGINELEGHFLIQEGIPGYRSEPKGIAHSKEEAADRVVHEARKYALILRDRVFGRFGISPRIIDMQYPHKGWKKSI